MKELVRVNQELEEETIAQRHIIHLEKIKAEQESREMEERTNQLMQDLAQEKLRLEEDIEKMHKNKVSHDLSGHQSIVAPAPPSTPSLSRACGKPTCLPPLVSLCWPTVSRPPVPTPASCTGGQRSSGSQ